jgi:hypothetical protein
LTRQRREGTWRGTHASWTSWAETEGTRGERAGAPDVSGDSDACIGRYRAFWEIWTHVHRVWTWYFEKAGFLSLRYDTTDYRYRFRLLYLFFLARTRSFLYRNVLCSSSALYLPSAAPSSLNFLTLMLPSPFISSDYSHTFLPCQVNMVSPCFLYEAYGT